MSTCLKMIIIAVMMSIFIALKSTLFMAAENNDEQPLVDYDWSDNDEVLW